LDDGRGTGAVLTIRTVAETGSTNADLLALARDGAGEDGLWLRAERQTAGRGRQGRDWSSPRGNLYASTLVHLRPADPPAPSLALVAAVALAETLLGFGAEGLHIKWPNDLLLGAAKVSGILLERTDDWVVIGFGVNLARAPDIPDRVTGSLAALTDAVTPERAVAALGSQLDSRLEDWRSDFAMLVERWTALAHPIGTPLRAGLPDGSVTEGRFDGLTRDGALRLRLADGTVRVIHAADVFEI
jgi:BirA family transcriptional regulator, biotin operon repressor / biotin---[acetyl-CoA-carboxylase] ligase